jgi:hypothetical protein
MVGATITFVKAYAQISQVTGSEYKFYYDTMSITDVAAVLITKPFADGYAVSDVALIDVSLAASEAISFSDSVTRTVTYSRNISDAFTLDDTLQSDSIEATKGNIATLSDVLGIAFTTGFSDQISSITDNQIATVGKNFPENISITDDLSATFAWSRSFSDAPSVADAIAFAHSTHLTDGFALDDAALVDKNYSGTKGNVFSVTDSISITRTHGRALGNMALGNLTLN